MALSDEALLAAHVAGERSAFPELFARYAPRLTAMFRRDLGGAAEVGDLVQQTFLQLHRARRDFDPSAKLRPWLYTIALNLKRQHFRRKGRRPESPLEDEDERPSPIAGPERRVADTEVRRALEELPEAQRDVIVLHWFEGLSFKEIARVVGASQSAVKVRAHRGYGKLRGFLRTPVTKVATPTYTDTEGA